MCLLTGSPICKPAYIHVRELLINFAQVSRIPDFYVLEFTLSRSANTSIFTHTQILRHK